MQDLKLVLEYTSTLHILYVEDNEALRESTLMVLENFFQKIDVAVDGLAGLDQYQTFLAQEERAYDLIISDINMPKLNGIEMSQKILEINPQQSILFVTAHNEIEYLHSSIKLGISSFLLKPLNLKDLATVLYKVCQAIGDRKMVQEYYKMTEENNAQLEEQNRLLKEKNEEQVRLIRMLDTMVSVRAENHQEDDVEMQADGVGTHDLGENDAYFEQVAQLIEEDLTELQEIHDALDTDIISVLSSRDVSIQNIHTLFLRYASILRVYTVFEPLSVAMANLAQAISQEPEPKNLDNMEQIFSLLETVMYILGKWQSDLSKEELSEMIPLDLSIVGDLQSIQTLWLATKEEADVALV